MALTAMACKIFTPLFSPTLLTAFSYHGQSDLQLERMNVYFNEVGSETE
jgi:hypothetical protein